MITKKKPVKEFRIGGVKASVWENNAGEVTRHGVTVTKFYKEGEEWKTTDSFMRDDLLPLAKTLDQAHTWIVEQRQAPAQT